MQTRIMGGATATLRKHWESANMWRRSCLRPAKIEQKKKGRSMSMSDNQKWSILQVMP